MVLFVYLTYGYKNVGLESVLVSMRCTAECPKESCTSMLRQLMNEVKVVEIGGVMQTYIERPELHERNSSALIARLALCSARQTS